MNMVLEVYFFSDAGAQEPFRRPQISTYNITHDAKKAVLCTNDILS